MIENIIFYSYLAIIPLCAISAFVFRNALKSRMLVLFIPYLFYVSLQELIIFFDGIYNWGTSVYFAYNIFRLISVVVFALLFYQISFMKPVRKYIAGLAILYVAFFIITFSFFQSIYGRGFPLGMVRDLILTLYGILFLFTYFNYDDINGSHFWTPWVWITTGIVIFYPVSSISITFQPLIQKESIKLYQVIPQSMSIFMYGCFTYAFYLCQKKESSI